MAIIHGVTIIQDPNGVVTIRSKLRKIFADPNTGVVSLKTNHVDFAIQVSRKMTKNFFDKY